MTLLDWRKNGERRSLALDVLNNPTVKEMLSVMEDEHPAKRAQSVGDGFGATLELGRIKGFQQALDMLRSFAEALPTPPEQISATWGVEEESKF